MSFQNAIFGSLLDQHRNQKMLRKNVEKVYFTNMKFIWRENKGVEQNVSIIPNKGEKPYMICVNFRNDLLDCWLTTHIIFLQGMLQFFHCYVPELRGAKMTKNKVTWESVLRMSNKMRPKGNGTMKHKKMTTDSRAYPLLSLSKYSKAVNKCSSLSILFMCIVAVMNSM